MKWKIFLVWLGFVGVIIKAVSAALEEIQPEFEARKNRVAEIRKQYEDKEEVEEAVVVESNLNEGEGGTKY